MYCYAAYALTEINVMAEKEKKKELICFLWPL